MVHRTHAQRPTYSVHSEMYIVIGLPCGHIVPVFEFDNDSVN